MQMMSFLCMSSPKQMNTERKWRMKELSVEFKKRVIKVLIKLIDYMKFKKILSGIGLSGIGGAECLLCELSPDDWCDIKQINEGFPITRLYPICWKKTQKHYITTFVMKIGKAKDVKVRKGLSCKPLTTSSQRSTTITCTKLYQWSTLVFKVPVAYKNLMEFMVQVWERILTQ